MVKNIYSVKDALSGFGELFLDHNDAAAVRGFKMAVSANSASILGFQPKDFDLYRVGQFDTDTGVLSSDVAFVCNAAQLQVGDQLEKS